MRLLIQANADAELQRAIRQVCERDPVRFMRDWWFTYDPRLIEIPGVKLPAYIPFEPFARQVELFEWTQWLLREGLDGVFEKTRGVGGTNSYAALAGHGLLYRPGFSAAFTSRTTELADTLRDPRSILEKVRIGIRRLPRWLIPDTFDPGTGLSHKRLTHGAIGSSVIAEGGDYAGTGDRKTLRVVDEVATIPRVDLLEGAVVTAQRTCVWMSTPKGMNNGFARLRFSNRLPVFTLRWQDDPRYDDAWYEQEAGKLDPVVAAQELDLDYHANAVGVVIPAKWVQACVDFPLPREGQRRGGFDVASTGRDGNVLAARHGPVVLPLEAWHEDDPIESAGIAADLCDRFELDQLHFDEIGVGASVDGALRRRDPAPTWTWVGINAAHGPTERVYDDSKTKASERFLNLRAEMWWSMRMRCYRTWQVANGKAEHDPQDLVSLPNDPVLVGQLSLPRRMTHARGRTKVESKDDIRRRMGGSASPDRADGVVMCFWEPDVFRVLI